MGKYDHLFIPCGQYDDENPQGKWIMKSLDSSMVSGSNYYVLHWIMPGRQHPDPVGHPPHVHNEDELLFHIGTNPDDPTDLGAEVEIYMGEEMERHVITRSTCIYFPAGMVHSPWTILKTERPWIVMQVQQSTQRTEKFLPQLCVQELRDSIDWSRFVDDHAEAFEK